MSRMISLVRKASSESAPLIVLNAFGDEGKLISEALEKYNVPEYSMLVITVTDWSVDLSPWKASAVFKGEPDFAGGADQYLDALVKEIIPETLETNAIKPSAVYIAGYSMAGLFSLYSLYNTNLFAGAASCSGSLWFPGFKDFASANDFNRKPERIYMSLGDREARTKNPVMATVEDSTRALADFYTSKGIDVLFEMNNGGHFNEPVERTAKGIAALIR